MYKTSYLFLRIKIMLYLHLHMSLKLNHTLTKINYRIQIYKF